jgi:hypothetical protein
MDNSLLKPSSEIFKPSSRLTLTSQYRILSIDLSKQVFPYYYAYLSAVDSSVTVKAGQIVDFKSCRFYIKEDISQIKAVYIDGDISALENNSLGSIVNIAKPDYVKSLVMSDQFPLGSLSVRVEVPFNHKQGFLGWTFFKDDIVLVVGNDLEEAGYISYQGTSAWAPGSYRLVVAAYEQYSQTLTKLTDKEFELTTATESITVGTSSDDGLPLTL